MKPPEEKLYDYQAEGVDTFAAWVQNTGPEAPSEALISLAMGMGKTRRSVLRYLFPALSSATGPLAARPKRAFASRRSYNLK